MADDDKPENDIVPTDQDVEVAEEITEIDDPLIHNHDDDPLDEDGGLARKTLTGLTFIVVGGVLALWLGPKIAPNLPQGMAPVAEWLAPGGAANQEELDAFRAEIRAELASMPDNLTSSQIENIVAGRIANIEGRMVARLNELNSQFVVHDTTELESRLSALEIKTEGLRAELGALTEQISVVSASGGEISADTAERIATYSAALEGLKAEIEGLAAQNGALSQRLDEATQIAETQVDLAEAKVDEVETAAERQRLAITIAAAFDAIDAALDSGASFERSVQNLTDSGITVPDVLTANSGGIETLPELRAAFPDAAHEILRAAIVADNNSGILNSVGTFFKAQVVTRSLTPQEGDSVDAILSRAEFALKNDAIQDALIELATLPEPLVSDPENPLMGAWLSAAQTRYDTTVAFETTVTGYEATQ